MERSELLLDASKAVLVIVDVQARLLEPIKVAQKTIRNIQHLAEIAKLLEIPIIATTHNAEKLGGIAPEFESADWASQVIDKLTFSCVGSDAFLRRLQGQGRSQVLLVGIESHICVLQTALDLIKLGYPVHIPFDATASREKTEWKYALRRLQQAGVVITSTESAIYEMLYEAGTDTFRSALPLLKERAQAVEEDDD